MRVFLFSLLALVVPLAEADANDWEKLYTSFGPTDGLIVSTTEPEVLPFGGNVDQHLEQMWRQGFVAIGYTNFNTTNSKTADAKRFAKKLKARFLVVSTDLTSSNTSSIPITTPTTTTSQTSGTARLYGSGGSASGTYSGTTTTYGTQTNYFPITVNRFDKMAIYFMEAPKYGAGIMPRELTSDEVTKYETRRALVVRWVRDGSPAYFADLLPNDVILTVNEQPADSPTWQNAIRSGQPLALKVMRNGSARDITLTIPDEWRPQ